ncbi:MAG: hypothetical protein HY532_09205 [Chloroflexi bacterium]|nr:hypothetical protein [Chloroflexota bacterium]
MLDMAHVTFIHPIALVGFLRLYQKLHNLGKKIHIKLPISGDVVNYLANVHFLEALESVEPVAGSPQVLNRLIPDLTTIVPVQRFDNEGEVEALAQRLEEAMGTMGGLMPSCYTIVAELASNVVHHSGVGNGWAMVQRYGYSTGSIIEIAVGDWGKGVRNSLRGNEDLALKITSARDAIRLAIKEGSSRFKDPHRGYGLHHIRTEVKAPQRQFTLRSGTGCLVVYDNGRFRTKVMPSLVGVLAEARIPC